MALKIAVVSLYLPTGLKGGVPQQVDLLGNALAKRGHAVTVFSLYPKPEGARYKVHRVRLPSFLDRLVRCRKGWGIFFFPWFLRAVDFSAFDVIHAHGDSHFIRTTRPVVRTFHSSGLDLALTANRLIHILGMLAIYPFEWISGIRATRCAFVGSRLSRYFPGLAGPVIPNGIDFASFKPAPVPRSRKPSVLFVAGTASGRKRGFDLAREFARRVRPQCPDAELWMVCPERVEEFGVIWLGPQHSDHLVRLYQRCWVFCLPSRFETFGIPYVEAMACGAPVVATPNDGARDVLDNGRYGEVVPFRRLGETLVRLLEDPDRREALSKAGLARAASFGIDAVASRYEALYDEALKDAR